MKIVIKIGTSTLTHSTGRTNIRRVADLCRVISDLKNAGHEIILVSSGAIAMGVGKLNLSTRPSDAPTKQAAAAVGQCELMYIYDRLFAEHNHTVAQLLITAPDIDDARRISTTRWNVCWHSAFCPSSTRTTPFPRRSWASETTIRCPQRWQPA